MSAHNTRAFGFVLFSASLVMMTAACKEQEARVLRMDVEIGNVKALPIGLPSGTSVNFPAVAKDLFYRQVMNHNHFNIVTPAETASASTANSVAMKSLAAKSISAQPTTRALQGLGADDLKLLKKYGMLNRLSAPAPTVGAKIAPKAFAATTDATPINQCLYERPLAKLGTDVLSFAMNFGGGIKLGYDSLGGIAIGSPVGVSAHFESAKMDLTVRWDDNFTQQSVAMAEGVSYSSDAKAGLGLGSFPLGLDFFYKTPLADVVKSAFTVGLDEAVSAYVMKTAGAGKSWNEAWEARVISDPSIDNDNFVAFRSGTYAGVVKGDKFTVRNQTYRWVDDSNPCISRLKYTLPDGDIVAELEVTESSNLITIAKVKALADGSIRPGAQVKVLSLFVPPQPNSQSSQTLAGR